MKVERNYKFTFSKLEVKIIREMWEPLNEMDANDFIELTELARCEDFFDDLDKLLRFAENNVE